MQHQDELPPELMLEIIEKSLNSIPDEAKPEARREAIAMFAGIFERAGSPIPEWIRLGRSRWGRP